MTTSKTSELENYTHLLKNLPPIKTEKDRLNEDGLIKCACDKKYISCSEARMFNTGYTVIADTHCHDCLKDYKGLCPIVCIACKKIVAWLAPGKDGDGFTRLKGRSYHIQKCPDCIPEDFTDKDAVTVLIEKQIYKQRNQR